MACLSGISGDGVVLHPGGGAQSIACLSGGVFRCECMNFVVFASMVLLGLCAHAVVAGRWPGISGRAGNRDCAGVRPRSRCWIPFNCCASRASSWHSVGALACTPTVGDLRQCVCVSGVSTAGFMYAYRCLLQYRHDGSSTFHFHRIPLGIDNCYLLCGEQEDLDRRRRAGTHSKIFAKAWPGSGLRQMKLM